MWLLNHTSARKFEIPMLKSVGFTEIFLPKSYPDDPKFRSASIDDSEDRCLTIPRQDLAVLNAADWYGEPGQDAWAIANRHFDILFFALFEERQCRSIFRNFEGSILWRAYGLPAESTSYSAVLSFVTNGEGASWVRRSGRRFWFSHAYAHQADCEAGFMQARAIHLPLGMSNATIEDHWRGTDRRIFFVCGDIESNPYYKGVYRQFIADFHGLPYAIGGAQSLHTNDSNVLGYVPRETHERNMREMRVMFYHSSVPNHIHYHPFEAIRVGMPLVFMAGGILDRFGGEKLPGRCKTVEEAHHKVRRILDDDRELIEDIRKSQAGLLEPMKPENCVAAWRIGLQSVLDHLEIAKAAKPSVARAKRRIAVIVPAGYRGGSLRGAKLLAQAIELGSQQAGEAAEVVFGHLDDPATYANEEFADLPGSIQRRPYQWRVMPHDAARRAMTYAGLERPMTAPAYAVPDDGIQQFMDCDLWVMVSDWLPQPLLPIRPYVLMVYDYLQRYSLARAQETNHAVRVQRAHAAEHVLVTTEFTRQDAVQFAGLPGHAVTRVPMLAPAFADHRTQGAPKAAVAPYFLWTTNLAAHKNHENAIKALRDYYDKYQGQLDCRVTGVGTDRLLKADLPHLMPLRGLWTNSPALKRHMKLAGELPDPTYQATLADARFLWHAGAIDNGTRSVIEAAHLGVPSLSSDYPTMREIDAQFDLNLLWMDPHDPDHMARQLKRMEVEAAARRLQLPSEEELASQSVEKLAPAYWTAVRECL